MYRSNEQKRNDVLKILKQDFASKLGSKKIAQLAAVSKAMVIDIRRELNGEATSYQRKMGDRSMSDNFSISPQYKDFRTAGNFIDEEQSQTAFEKALAGQPFFRVHREVTGWYYGGQPFQERSECRIDFILIPNMMAISKGWKNGIIGIECKASGKKAGPVFCQLLDYTRAVFQDPVTGGNITLNAVFLWPNLTGKNPFLVSVASQNRIGFISHETKRDYETNKLYNRLSFNINSTHILTISDDNTMTCKPIVSGRKSGSR